MAEGLHLEIHATKVKGHFLHRRLHLHSRHARLSLPLVLVLAHPGQALQSDQSCALGSESAEVSSCLSPSLC